MVAYSAQKMTVKRGVGRIKNGRYCKNKNRAEALFF
jgi:hypothetical protein